MDDISVLKQSYKSFSVHFSGAKNFFLVNRYTVILIKIEGKETLIVF